MKGGHTCLIGALVLVALAVALVLIAAPGQSSLAAGAIIYVDVDAAPGGDGTSWDNAFTDLQPALAAAVAGDKIWVAAGTYTPTVEHGGTGDRYRSFQLVNGVALYGGFDPSVGAIRWEHRDWVAHAVILSGDLDGDDVPPFGNNEENSYHVFFHPDGTNLDRTTILDGFTVTGGNADDFDAPWYGGGMYNDGSSPTLVNCTFSGNWANFGGGMYNDHASPVLANCTFSGNYANDHGGGMDNASASPVLAHCTFEDNFGYRAGGGMYNDHSSPALTDCTFEGNSAHDTAGGMCNISSSPTLAECTFENNSANQAGGMRNVYSSLELTNCVFSGNSSYDAAGGVYNFGSSLTLADCTFSGNSAGGSGGGMLNDDSSLTLTDCTFEGNSAGQGGGMYNSWASTPVLTNCIFSENSARDGGGMYNYRHSSPVLANCTFSGNSADTNGGGILNYEYSSPVLTNCTFSGNSATNDGGAMFNSESSSPALTNCILWGDAPDEIFDDLDCLSVVTYSDIQDGYAGEGNIDADPLFADAANDDYHLLQNSPCIDVGNNAAAYLPGQDFEGDDRILDGDGDATAIVDMGVDEYRSPAIFVDLEAGGANTGTSWEHAFTDLQIALDAAVAGDQIWVAAGTYTPTVEHGGTGGRYRSFQLMNGVALYGGFDPSVGATDWEDRDWVSHETTLSGDLNGDDVPPFGNNEENSYHVFYHPEGTDLDGSAILDGFTVTGGNAGGIEPHEYGGGMTNDGASPTLANCTFSGNWATYGGGMYNDHASPALSNCTFSGNWGSAGGGMFNTGSSPSLTNCTFSSNSANSGGGMRNDAFSSPSLTGCTFSGNSSNPGEGGGMRNFNSSSPTLINCTFEGNSARNSHGGGMYNGYSSPTLVNCIFQGNSAGYSGGGMDNYFSSPTLTNCTFSENSALDGGGMLNDGDSSPTLTDCTFTGNWARDGGGMANLVSSAPTLANCIFHGNLADLSGGGMANFRFSSPTLTNCTFSGNEASGAGALHVGGEASATLINCILWGDTPFEIWDGTQGVVVVAYSDIQGGYPGEGNIDADPLFLSPGNGDFHLPPDSPCIDVASNAAPDLPPYDFEGDPRVIDGDCDGTATVDMGVDEARIRTYMPVMLRGYQR